MAVHRKGLAVLGGQMWAGLPGNAVVISSPSCYLDSSSSLCPHCRREGGAWRQGDKPQFDVQHLQYKLKGNNVPMPSTLVKHLLRIFIPEIIQRRLLPLLPKEFGDYMLTGE